MKTMIISVENPQPMKDGVPGCTDYRHSKYVRRRKYVEDMLAPAVKELGYPVEIFPAVTDVHFTFKDGLATYKDLTVKIGPQGNMGNFLSHMSLWQTCVETGEQLLILEDDARLPVDSLRPVHDALKEFELVRFDDNAFLYLQAERPEARSLKDYAQDHLAKVNGCQRLWHLFDWLDTSGTAAYAINPRAAGVLLGRARTTCHNATDAFLNIAFNAGVTDCYIMRDWKNGFHLYEVWEPWQHDHDPTIQGAP